MQKFYLFLDTVGAAFCRMLSWLAKFIKKYYKNFTWQQFAVQAVLSAILYILFYILYKIDSTFATLMYVVAGFSLVFEIYKNINDFLNEKEVDARMRKDWEKYGDDGINRTYYTYESDIPLFFKILICIIFAPPLAIIGGIIMPILLGGKLGAIIYRLLQKK